MSTPNQSLVSPETKDLMVKLVTSLLTHKPEDPVPHIYSFIAELSRGGDPNHIQAITDNELNELRNLEKKAAYLRDQIGHDDGEHTQTDEDESEEEVDDIQPKKKNIKAQRKGVSAEVYGEYNKKGDFKPKVIPKNAQTIEKLKKRLLQAFMFSALDEGELKIVIDAIEEIKGKAGDCIIKEGDQGDCMYVLEDGALDCTKVFAGNSAPTWLKEYAPGEGFGELALLYNAPRAATITAKTNYVIWKLDRDTFNNIVKDAAAKKREKYENFLKNVEVLKTLDDYERSKLGDAVKEENYVKGDLIIKEGEEGDKFFLISEGTCIATKQFNNPKPDKVKDYSRGNYFGERALLTNENRAANIEVTSDKCMVLSIDRQTFIRMLGPLDDILKRNMEEYS